MTAVSPHLEAPKKEGESGRKKLNQYTRYGTVGLAAVQALGIAVGLEGTGSGGASPGVDPRFFFRFTTGITLTGRTPFLIWLGGQSTARGVCPRASLFSFSRLFP